MSRFILCWLAVPAIVLCAGCGASNDSLAPQHFSSTSAPPSMVGLAPEPGSQLEGGLVLRGPGLGPATPIGGVGPQTRGAQ